MSHPAWILIVVGLLLAAVGAVWLLLPSLPWLGRLPGDIQIKTNHTSFFFPTTTCILLSVLLTVLLWIVRQFWW
jgi:hypothetical protein